MLCTRLQSFLPVSVACSCTASSFKTGKTNGIVQCLNWDGRFGFCVILRRIGWNEFVEHCVICWIFLQQNCNRAYAARQGNCFSRCMPFQVLFFAQYKISALSGIMHALLRSSGPYDEFFSHAMHGLSLLSALETIIKLRLRISMNWWSGPPKSTMTRNSTKMSKQKKSYGPILQWSLCTKRVNTLHPLFDSASLCM